MARGLVLILKIIFLSAVGFSSEISKPSLSSTNYLVDSASKIDELIEQIEFKESLNQHDKISFTLATLSYLTPISLAMINHSLQEYKYFLPIAETSLVNTTASLNEFINNFSLAMSSLKIYSESEALKDKIENFTVHRADLPFLKNILKTVRARFSSLLQNQVNENLANRPNANVALYDVEKMILRNRPSYQAIYKTCSADPGAYKSKVKLVTLKNSIADLYRLAAFSPAVIKLQMKSYFSSPSLDRYLSQEVLPSALEDCFSQDKSSNKESFADFTKELHNIEDLSRAVVLSGAATALYLGRNIFSHPAAIAIIHYFSKTTRSIARRSVVMSTIIAGIYCSFQLKKTFDLVNDKYTERFTPQQYTDFIKSSFKKQVHSKITELQKMIEENSGHEATMRTHLLKELEKWKTIDQELST